MLKSYEIADPRSCLRRAADDEPLFVLRANDPLAPSIVRAWARDYRIVHQGLGTYSDERRLKYDNAMAIAEAMEKWRKLL